MQDDFYQFGSVSLEKIDAFRLVKKSRSVYDSQVVKAWTHLHIEVSFDVTKYERDVYSAADVLRDVGGLSSSVISGFTVLVLILTYNRDRFKYVKELYDKDELVAESLR